MKSHFTVYFLLSLLLLSCTKFDGASPTSRNSLIHFYGTTVSQTGVKALIDSDGGFIIIGNVQKSDLVTDIVVVKTDGNGQTLWSTVVANSSASDIKIVSDGYLIVGDGIEYHPNADRISEIINTKAILLKVPASGTDHTAVPELSKTDSVNTGTVTVPVYSRVDFHGNAMTYDGNGDLVILGSYKSPETGALEKSLLVGVDPTSYAPKWVQQQEFLQKRDYVNSHAIHLSSTNNLLWAATSQLSSQSLTDAYLSVVYTGSGSSSSFKNNSKYGENSGDHYFTGADIQPSGAGYGVVGTYARTDNSSANIYFIRVDASGFINSKPKFFDGQNVVSDSTASDANDSGNAITGTQDGGFVIAGARESIPGVGFGGSDIVLIKVDAFGEFIWSKVIGGSGDDVPSSIIETPDGKLLVCGMNKVNGLSSIFVMRTDKDGELTN